MKQKYTRKLLAKFAYLKFSRTQRRAILFIAFWATAGMLLLKSGILLSENETTEHPFVAAEINNELVVRSATNNHTTPYASTYTRTTYPARTAAPEVSFQSGTLITFDPNTVSFEQLIEMGLREKAARNLVNYRAKGGQFRKAEDLGKLYGLHKEEVEKLMPFVSIKTEMASPMISATETTDGEFGTPNRPIKNSANFNMKLDVNLADSLTWTILPGIGAKRASSILKFRSKLGGFANVEQVGETFGLPDSVFQKIRPHLHWSATTMQQISLNEATEAQLKSHPYIPWQLAKIIVAYRNQHGPYEQVDDLLKIHIVQRDWLEKVRPYLKAVIPANTSMAINN